MTSTETKNSSPTTTDETIEELARRARAASRVMLSTTAEQRDQALSAVHSHLNSACSEILSANDVDKAAAAKRLEKGELSSASTKRLELGGSKFTGLLAGINAVRGLEDPVGKCTLSREIDSGLQLYRVACPIGVIAVIFESRPEAAVQIASLAIKSANAVILKGGREAEYSNSILVSTIRTALSSVKFPIDAVQLVATRDEVRSLLAQTKYVDLIIPRGSNQLVSYITENTRIPVMGHADGICAVYVDKSADINRAKDIVVDAKAQYPAVCNAAETLIIHEGIAKEALPVIGAALAKAGVEVFADKTARMILADTPKLKVSPATAEHFVTEFLELKMAVKVVQSIEEAIEHINLHGSGHTDAIVTEDEVVANKFMAMVDSAGVYHNASTRFADGFRLGFGAEVGVSTHRTHARGPVGLEGLMIYKYKMIGQGHIVKPYADGEKEFHHRDTPERIPSA